MKVIILVHFVKGFYTHFVKVIILVHFVKVIILAGTFCKCRTLCEGHNIGTLCERFSLQ